MKPVEWEITGPKGFRSYWLNGRDSGYSVHHCGHPTANWPYYGRTPTKSLVVSSNGRGFRLLETAKAAIELIYQTEQAQPAKKAKAKR